MAPITSFRVTDLKKARNFYEGKLGLKPDTSMADDMGVLYQAGEGTSLYIYVRQNASIADNTQATFKVDNFTTIMDELSQKGINFEHYDMPGLKTD